MNFFRAKPDFIKIRKLLIVRNDRIGDVVLSLPLATVIKQQFPKIEVHVLLREYTRPLAENHPDVDKVLIAPDSLKSRGDYDKCLRSVARQEYDLAVVLHHQVETARMIRQAQIPYRVGRAMRIHSWMYNVRVYQRRRRPTRHELDYNLSMLGNYLQIPAREKVEVRMRASEEASRRVAEWLSGRGVRKYTIIHPGSGGSAVDLPVETCARLMGSFEFPGAIIITGSANEQALCAQLASHSSSHAVNAAGVFSIAEMMALISRCDLFISGSTGPLHIARAFERRLLGFYCTVPACHPMRWGPYGREKSNTILPPGETFETFQRSKRKSAEGMKRITVESIADKLKTILAQ